MHIKHFVFVILTSLLPTFVLAQLQLEAAFPSLTFTRPVDLQHSNDGSNRLFVVEQAGIIKVFQNENQVNSATTFLDIQNLVDDTSNEEGLLGLAFHPDYDLTGYFYLNYTASQPNRTVISRFSVSSTNPNIADPGSEVVFLEFAQPNSNHNGGQLAFGPSDGYLYIATGDGGSYGDPECHAQNLSSLLGKLLRIDVDQPSGNLEYSIPPDNPFASNTMGYAQEIFAYGLRNPWRFSFDPVTGWIWTGDVGQGLWEEIDLVTSGGNYGWSMYEGFHCYNSPWPCTPPCDSTGLTIPVWEYSHSEGLSITGGYVYRGNQVPELHGKYIYADYVSGKVWALTHNNTGQTINSLLINSSLNIASFGVDQDNELYICSFDGKIYRFQPTITPVTGDQPPSPSGFRLEQNFPNPFNNETVIPIFLSQAGFVQIHIYDIQGKRVQTLVDQNLSSGSHEIRWNSVNNTHHELSSGLYLYQFVVDSQVIDKKQMLLLK
jgi:glucose/arabinose dehydrogenase